MEADNRIDITGVDLVAFVRAVYERSVPQGMGILHYQPGPLPEDVAAELVHKEGPIAVSLDYVQGRACKMVVWREGERLLVAPRWFDHSDSNFDALLAEFGIKRPAETATA